MFDVEEGPMLDAAVVIVSVLFGLLGLALVILAVFTIFFCWHKKHIAKHVDATHFLIRKKENHAAYGRNDAGHAAGPSNADLTTRFLVGLGIPTVLRYYSNRLDQNGGASLSVAYAERRHPRSSVVSWQLFG